MTNSKNARNVVAYRRRIKTALVHAFGETCILCKHKYFQEVFEFHHIHPENKSFNLSNANTTRSKDTCVSEAKKCVMLCANCHRIVEYSGQTYDFVSNFNEDLFFTKLNELNGFAKRERKKAYQQQKKLLAQQNRSSKPTKEELKSLIRTTAMTHIGAMYGVSDNAVRKWAVKYGLPNRVSDIAKYTDIEWSKL